jgi:hypothetical protein
LCSEYFKRMSGAASSSMTPGSKPLPQKSVNQRPTTALLSSIDMDVPSLLGVCSHVEDGGDDSARVGQPVSLWSWTVLENALGSEGLPSGGGAVTRGRVA